MVGALGAVLSDAGAVGVGAFGAVGLTVTARLAEAAPVLPAASVAIALKLWLPLASVAVV